MSDSNGCGGNIATEISGIMPTAGHIKVWRIRCLVHVVLKENRILRMAGCMCIFTGIFAGKCTAAALEVKTFHQIQLELFINMVSNDKGVGAFPVPGKNIIASGSGYFRKIKLVNMFSGTFIHSGIHTYSIINRMLCLTVN